MTAGVEWDEAKRRKTLIERGVDFADAALIFINKSALFEAIDVRSDYGESCIRALGEETVNASWSLTRGAVRTVG